MTLRQMLRTLLVCLLALLAVPAAAQVSTSKTVTITVTGPSGVCTQPPAAPAVAAGFTTPVLCSDWTVQMPPNWLGGCAVAGNGSQTNPNDNTGHVWYNNIWWSNTNQACTSVQHADPAFGNLALDMPWTSSSAQQQVGMTLQTAAWFSTDTTDANQGISVPNNFYMETVARQTPIAQGSFFAFWTWPLLAMTQGSTGQAGNELDSVELDSGNLNNSDSAYHNWLLNSPGPWVWQGICGQGAVPQGLPCGFDPTQYHTYSSLMTSDGVNNLVCSYVDGVLLMCQPSPGGFTPVQAVARYFILLQNACDWWNYPSNFCNAGLNQHTYVKSVKLWSCPTWQATQCNGSGGGGPNGPNQLSRTWVNSNGTQAVTTAPDGTPALRITQDSSANVNHGVTQTGAFPTTTSTFGANIAPGSGSGATQVQLLVCTGTSLSPCTDWVAAFFNPTTGTLIRAATASGGTNDHFLGAGSTALPGSCSPNCGFHVWYTYSLPTSAQLTAFAGTGAQATGDGSSSTLVWNWALETGSNAPTDGISPSPTTVNATDFCAANGGGNGSAGSPWKAACIQAAANAASAGNTVFLAAGNWALNTSNTGVTITKSITLTGAGSGNTFNATGNPNNANGTDFCPTASSSITCVMTTGSNFNTTGGWIAFRPPCTNDTVSHIFFDGSLVTAGGDNNGTLNVNGCNGFSMTDIRFLAFNNDNVSAETQLSVQSSSNILLQNSVIAVPASSVAILGRYANVQVYEPVFTSTELVQNNVFYQGFYNPTDDDNSSVIGNVFQVFNDGIGDSSESYLGMAGCQLTQPCAAPGSQLLTGTYHFTVKNNYFFGPGHPFGIGGGVNDQSTGGGISDLNFNGNWLNASTSSIAGCMWHVIAPDRCKSGVNSGGADGMQVNGTGGPGGNCSIAPSGTCFNIFNNSIVGTTVAELDATGNGVWGPSNPSPNHNTTTVNFNAHQNYISSPANAYLHDGNTVSPSVTGNFCAGTGTFVQTDSTSCATSGFNTAPTVSFTLGALSGSVVPITNPTFTAQYGAVQWIASTSSTPPTSGDSRWYHVPPVSLSGVSHGNTVFMWVMDSANHISAAASVAVP